MSRQEKDALVAYVNSFKPSKPVTDFAQLADGKALMEVMGAVDSTHFKNVPARGITSQVSSSENWVLRMNSLKRLYRLLLSFPLPEPHPSSLSLSSLSDPPFSSIAKTPTMREGVQGLLQICRFCLAASVWAPGNEKVIMRIQKLKEEHMAELMKSIEAVTATLPAEHQKQESGTSSLRPSPDLSYSPPRSGLRDERDKLLQENDDLRTRCERMMEQVADLTSKLEEANEEHEDALESLSRGETLGAGLRGNQTAGASEIERLKADLLKAEENLVKAEEDLEKQTTNVSELTKQIEQYKAEAAEAGKLKDQLDEYRHTAERLRKSENVIEKYRKKLEESANLRRELRNLEEENASLVNTNSSLEADLKKAVAFKGLLDNYKSQIESFEKQTAHQATEIAELNHQLEVTQHQLESLQSTYEQHQEELQLSQEKLKEIELTGVIPSNGERLKRRAPGDISLGDELGEFSDDGDRETKTDLRLKIKSLQRELSDLQSSAPESHRLMTLETLLADANKSKDRYQADYLKAHKEGLRLSAALETIREGRDGDNSQNSAALKQRLDEVLEERDALLKERQELEIAKGEAEKALAAAKVDLSLVGKDQRDILASLRESVEKDASNLGKEVVELKEQIEALREKDRQDLEEIKTLLKDKVNLQTASIDQRERALEKERVFSELKASMSASGVPAETQQKLLSLYDRNTELSAEIEALQDKFDVLSTSGGTYNRSPFEQAQIAYEKQITSLQAEVTKLKESNTTLKKQYDLEQQLMLTAWHDLGQKMVRGHLHVAMNSAKRSQAKPMPNGWLGRQRRIQENASYART
ncbi:hypothetical protein C351_03418 [Cryptococcus neoformans c8]|nr:hypothetical protein C353_03696 [Cryptococcus neoformans var. grubii AD1-83a]OXG57643.1 hypothetical protein C354_03631 [Cryptococcus neoformans var. grubii MW-RSA1955]OXG62422.1 hypothetical protein C352_03643 [Cryptococcus neoformans var. grubii CHC193]OXG62724.1 hypothetical protein C351_03418 [Cryptococcus neoformans var. grubii c8]OXH09480.1 hypothetical protein C369_03671 [Cryptococcus neoformans var. grubii A5-35-17]OXH11015.1 hypothetical protein C370_03684 [Cryptococcus neoformans 